MSALKGGSKAQYSSLLTSPTVICWSQDKPRGVLAQMAGEPLDALRSQPKQDGRQSSAMADGHASAPGARKGTKQAHAAESHGVHMSASEVGSRSVALE